MSARQNTARSRREVWFATGGKEFLLRRPRDAEVIEWMGAGKFTLAINAVVDWRNVSSNDICGDGSQDPAPFDPEDAEEYLLDHIDLLTPILLRVKEMIIAKRAADEDAQKN
jgi:hypothetical protein